MIATGTRLGPYEILAPLGAGGMGEVYRARDTKLKRDVAVKVLPDLVVSDPDRLARFHREAEVLASLNHPNIAHIYGVEDSSSTHALVMELVEGPTLADRIAEGPVPLNEALPIAKQIAEALEAAHEQGIIHRDLKPANIKVRSDGTVKVLDFGLAKAMEPAAGSSPSASMSPTITTPAMMTGVGMILGTAAYMSPEQAAGKPVDRRADIWSFGVVLWEMLTGRRLFDGETVSHTLADVLRAEIPFADLPPATPSSVVTLVKRCLTRDARARLRDIGEARITLQHAMDHPDEMRAAPPLPGARRAWLPLAVASAALGVTLGATTAWWLARRAEAPAAQVTRFFIPSTPQNPYRPLGGIHLLITPDGSRIVYSGRSPGEQINSFFLRELGSLESAKIRGTEGGTANPFLSADGRTLVFRRTGTGVMSVVISGGSAERLLKEDQPRYLGGAWAPDGTVVLGLGDGLFRVAGKDGALERLTGPEADTITIRAGTMLPGGRVVLFSVYDTAALTERIDSFDLGTRQRKTVVENGSEPKYLPPGYLLFGRQRNLMASAFDAPSLATTGDAVVVQPDVQRGDLAGLPLIYDVSSEGTLVYAPLLADDGGPDTGAPVYVDRRGQVLGTIAGPIERPRALRLSPDASRLAVSNGGTSLGNRLMNAISGTTLWLYDLAGRPPLRLVQNQNVQSLLWSRDGTTLFFTASVRGPFRSYSLKADGSQIEATEVPLAPPPVVRGLPQHFVQDWHPDGRQIFIDLNGRNSGDIMVASGDVQRAAAPLVQTDFSEKGARVSPDGRWLAYASDRSGSTEVWVQPIAGGAPVRVSLSGGDEPLWSRNGRELFFRQGAKVISATLRASAVLQFDPAVELFEGQYLSMNMGSSWDVMPDGRFIMIPIRPRQGAEAPAGIVVVRNVVQEVRRLLTSGRSAGP